LPLALRVPPLQNLGVRRSCSIPNKTDPRVALRRPSL
jgi:hypothetical protein